MSTIHFIGGEKGGVGKSVMARLLSQYFLDNAIPYFGFDADHSHSTLSRYYSDFTEPVNIDVFESIDSIIEKALAEDLEIVIDLPSQSQRFLDRWIEENGVMEMCEDMGMPIYYWYVVDDGRDSVELLEKFLAKYDGLVQCLVVKNQGRGSDFSEVEAIPALNTGTNVPQQILLPALHGSTMHKIDKLDFSFWAAANAKEASLPHLSLMERQRTRVWLKKAFDRIGHIVNQLATANTTSTNDAIENSVEPIE